MAKFTVKDVRSGNFNKLNLQETEVSWMGESVIFDDELLDEWMSESKLSDLFYLDGDRVVAAGELLEWGNVNQGDGLAIYDFGMSIKEFKNLSRSEVFLLASEIESIIDRLKNVWFTDSLLDS